MHHDLSSLLNALDQGELAEVAESIYWQQLNDIPVFEQNPNEFLFRPGDDEAVLFWREANANNRERAKFYARLIFGRLESRKHEGWITFSMMGSPRLDRPFPYIVVGTGGDVEGMEFLQRYCFKSLEPIHTFLDFAERCDLIKQRDVQETDFLFAVDASLFCAKEQGAQSLLSRLVHEPIRSERFEYRGPLPY